jgi:hypothetical protein
VLNVDSRKAKDPVKQFWSAQPDFPPSSQVKRESPLDAAQATITTADPGNSQVEAPPRTPQPRAVPAVKTVKLPESLSLSTGVAAPALTRSVGSGK